MRRAGRRLVGLGRWWSLAVCTAGLALFTQPAFADKYAATVLTAEETFLINDNSVASAGPTSKTALMMIVAPPGSQKHAYRYVHVQVEFDCAGRRARLVGPVYSGLVDGRLGKEDSPDSWLDAAPDTKMGATLAHVCGSGAGATMLQGDYATPAAAAEFVISKYVMLSKPAP